MRVTAVGLVLFGLSFAVARSSEAAALTEWQVPFAAAQLGQIAVGEDGVHYFDFDGGTGTTYLGVMDPERGKLREMVVPFSSSTGNDLRIRPADRALFVASPDTGEIAIADVERRDLTRWSVPPEVFGGPRSLAFDDQGRVLFLESSMIDATAIGRLDTTTNVVETWVLPDTIATPGSDIAWQMVAAADGSVFFNMNGFAHRGLIVRLDLTTGVFTAWDVVHQPVFGLATDATGAVYFPELDSDVRRVARLEPATGRLTEWDAPDTGSNLILESGRLFFDVNGVGIVALNPAAAGTDSVLTPVASDAVTPSSVAVAPVVTHRARTRVGHARPVHSHVPPTVAPPFRTWTTEAARFMTGDGAGGVYFTAGDDGANIGRLVPRPLAPPADDPE